MAWGGMVVVAVAVTVTKRRIDSLSLPPVAARLDLLWLLGSLGMPLPCRAMSHFFFLDR